MTIWQLWWGALFIKIALLPLLPITPDETYYFAWARHLSLSYFDHPPVVAWVMTLAQPLWKTPLGVRLPGVIVCHLSFLPWIGILRFLRFSDRAQVFWLLGLVVAPLVGLGGFIVTPDTPLILFWSLSVYFLLMASEYDRWQDWLTFGACTGLGLISKYTMVLMYPATLIYLVWNKKSYLLKKPQIWIAALVSFAFFTPVILWNYQNQWASFAFQTNHGLGGTKLSLIFPLEYVGTQVLLFNPILALIAIWVIQKRGSQQKLLTVFALMPLGFFFLTAFRSRVEANWPICGYPALMALVVTAVDHPLEWKVLKRWFQGSFVLTSVFVVGVLSHVYRPWIPIPQNKDHTFITREFAEDAKVAAAFHPLFTRSYQMAAFHSYFRPSDREVFKLKGLNRRDFYDFLPQSQPQGDAYLILTSRDPLPELYTSDFIFVTETTLPSGHVLYKMTPKSKTP